MKTYRIGILGCRGRGTAAARAYHAHPRTKIVALCDLIEERLNTLGEEVNVSARYTDLDEMIQQTRPDIVAIPTGTEFHYDLCMRVLEHGVHIEVEKPMCVDLVQADAVIAKAEEKGVQVAVHHQGRVGASMQALTRAFNAGKIGELRYMYGSGKGYYGGYGLMNIGTHKLNNMLHFGKRCTSVVAHLTTGGKPITVRQMSCRHRAVWEQSRANTSPQRYSMKAMLRVRCSNTGSRRWTRVRMLWNSTAPKVGFFGRAAVHGGYRHRTISPMARMTGGKPWNSSTRSITTLKVARRKRITGSWRTTSTP